jgi:hypothetical protein
MKTIIRFQLDLREFYDIEEDCEFQSLIGP